jgi:hypothetical protein
MCRKGGFFLEFLNGPRSMFCLFLFNILPESAKFLPIHLNDDLSMLTQQSKCRSRSEKIGD